MATWRNGTKAEHKIDLRIVVLDVNDCSPTFPETQVGSVYELSKPGKWLKLLNTVCNKVNYRKEQSYDPSFH